MEQRTIRLNFDLSFVYGPRTWRAPLVALMMLAAVGELDSESVTLSTYYPAPSGVYTNMITTNDTFMARDNLPAARTDGSGSWDSRVGLGLTNPTQKLSVQGNANASGRISVGRPVGWGAAGYLAPRETVDVAGNVRVGASTAGVGACAPSTTPNGACGGYITWTPGVYVDGVVWSAPPNVIVLTSALNPPNPVPQTPTYYCCTKSP